MFSASVVVTERVPLTFQIRTVKPLVNALPVC
jgi:hypothetical protein